MAAPAAVDKTLLALLNGIAKRVYFKDDSISDELLRTEVLGGIPETGSLINICCSAVTCLASRI